MQGWFLPALVTLLLYGAWGLCPKLASLSMSPKSAIIWQVAGGGFVAFIILVCIRFDIETNPRGIFFSALGGALGIIGGLTYLMAVSAGRVTNVVTLTALYPVVTVALAAAILGEPVHSKDGLALLFALAALVTVSL